MKFPSSHTSKRSLRRYIAIMLMAMYLVIAMGPLAPLSLQSKFIAHAVTGECVSDCTICRCSLEARANKTCCCAKKQLMLQERAKDEPKKCCLPESPKTSASTVPEDPPCCAGKKGDKPHGKLESTKQNSDNPKGPVLKCGCPCGKGKQLAFNGFGSNELIPVIIQERINPHHAETRFTNLSLRLASRHGEPPEPPPKLIIFS